MLADFFKKIDDIYNEIKKSGDIETKLKYINKFRKDLDVNYSFSEKYYNFVSMKKERGVVYTPLKISNYIIDSTISEEDIIKNPFLKIVDPACGCGNIIIPCFIYLRNIYIKNLDKINNINKLELREENINYHIIKNNLFGYDVDLNAIKVLTIDLFCESKCFSSNFLCKDFLLDEIGIKYDIFLSNPPYVGLKSINKEYSAILKTMYPSYKDKADISYCFFEKSILCLKIDGKLGFITSRYFLESQSGEELRRILVEKCSLYKIVDFYGIRPFKKAGIDTVMIFLERGIGDRKSIEIIKPKIMKNNRKDEFYYSLFNGTNEGIDKFYINIKALDSKRWILRKDEEIDIINKIEKNSMATLGSICKSYQGIITGCDKAFIVDKETALRKNLEKEILRTWIKNKNVTKYNVNKNDLYIIYSDFIDEPSKYPNAINYINEYKYKLQMRRECLKGIRKWYQLQWGRKSQVFEGKKIIFPYKASKNRFAIDKGSYFSADVYCIVINDESIFTYDYLTDILNSKTYEFYFKTFAKKLGENIYEYYPNTLMKLCIPAPLNYEHEFKEEMLYEKFGFTEREIKIINNII
ncbi:adenine-specific DNA-methyltransferase [Clostridium acetobutylicum]|uniref:site-specific DNA-methyltransferase (adenine-specific) n=1 Tax=Clostridium acetobutylicum (strain ATCC 824 / DSM 792 / JCM 1419 / IAM 19013 / LMG 5710 / NBRC 13948 / NRRL B-527 / VKM B-1787 / 2291 / W) TaxID=272562 RepID=Q97GQ7_CLOAB|nr:MULTISPECIES: class I SAM-dependent DNA methyltransferase [Clostridium]AAK80265.1 DNA modification methyltransferase [Clostridium acetobutylicum ATCC 824]ADZ21361.1 DNA modification methyltransferase [Clostridium acetobutylicum EA 2018]AEI33245.1 DNA modification methyltransferase [Clostridium acetobutylicum DSM 1731]AWV79312.1 class I SAM-dependent DNA methyltransferase [Clostridium acetobutylicum]MBC2394718.1 class I SAM-dependent DNA methyltransferase [Clostridium acetobutylicum]